MTTQEKVNLYLECQKGKKGQISKFGKNNEHSYYKLGDEIIAMFPQDKTPKEGERRVSDVRFININLQEITRSEEKEMRNAGQPTITIDYEYNQVEIG